MAQAKEMPVFKTIEAIKSNDDVKIDLSALKNEFQMSATHLPRGTTTKTGGLHPNLVASMFGYPDAQTLLKELNAQRKGIDSYVEAIVASQIKESYPELLENAPELTREAMTEAYNDKMAYVKRKELEILAKNDFPTLKKVSAKLIARLPKMADVVSEAQSLIGEKQISEIRPHKYLQAERSWAKEASKAFVKGDMRYLKMLWTEGHEAAAS